jgi:hypothetical protein
MLKPEDFLRPNFGDPVETKDAMFLGRDRHYWGVGVYNSNDRVTNSARFPMGG